MVSAIGKVPLTVRRNSVLRIGLLLTICAPLLCAQPELRFESATIQLAAPDALRNRVAPTGPERLSIPSMTLTWLVYEAYGEGYGTAYKVDGGPDWVDTTAYSIEATTAEPATRQEKKQMLRMLLAERFGLEVRLERLEDAEVHVLTLIDPDGELARNIRPWNGTCRGESPDPYNEDPYTPRCLSGYGGPGMFLEGATMYAAADLLSLPPSWSYLGGTLIEDQTGLEGRYTMRLELPFPTIFEARASENPEETEGPLLEAIRDQWGMNLEKGIGFLNVIHVESAERPELN